MKTNKLPETGRQRWARTKALLAEQRDARSAELLRQGERCCSDWSGKFKCRLPICPHCRRRNIGKQQEVVGAAFEGCTNSDLMFVSIVLPGSRDVEDIKPILLKGHQDLDNRIAAAGLKGVQVKGWYEIDAVGSHQFPLLPPDRHRLLCEIAPISDGQKGATWLPGVHAILRRGDHDIYDIRRALTAQWSISQQVNVRAFNEAKTVLNNLNRITSYATKFSSLTALRTDRRAVYLDPWPVTWDIELHSWLNSVSKRTPFEFMRFSMGFNAPRVSSKCVDPVCLDEGFPFTYSVTEIPMSIYTGCTHG